MLDSPRIFIWYANKGARGRTAELARERGGGEKTIALRFGKWVQNYLGKLNQEITEKNPSWATKASTKIANVVEELDGLIHEIKVRY